jgi:hypothetical protein
VKRGVPNASGLTPAGNALLTGLMRDAGITVLTYFKAALKLQGEPPTPMSLIMAAIRGAVDVARTAQIDTKDVLAMSLVTECYTEEQAHLAVAKAFRLRTEVESQTGVSHGPDMGRERGQS